jgi:Flp pilus assembly protein TadD
MRYLLALSISIFAVYSLSGCSSAGTKQRSGENKSSGSQMDDDPLAESGGSSSSSSSGGSSAAAVDTGPSKKELYDSIQISLGSGDDSVVEKSVANLLSQDHGDAKALNSLALYHMSKGRSHLGKMILKSILEKDSKNSAALNNLGVLYSQQGDRRQATESFRKALNVNPNYPVASANLGSIFAAGKDYGKAKQYLSIAYRGGIKDLSVLNNYATALMADNDSDTEDIFKEAMQIGASDAVVSFNYALFLTYIKKDYKQAGEIIDKIRFMGVPPQKKAALAKMEETISGQGSEENKAP